MKKCRKISLILLLGMLVLSFSACSGEWPESTTLYAKQNGTLSQILVDTDPDYTLSELKTYAEEEIADYNENTEEGEVKLRSSKERDGVIYMELSYGSSSDYATFNGMNCSLTTLEEAAAAGILPEESLIAQDGSEVDISNLLAENPTCHLLILAEHTLVETESGIIGASSLVTITGEQTALIGDGDADTSGYYPRKTDRAAYLLFE